MKPHFTPPIGWIMLALVLAGCAAEPQMVHVVYTDDNSSGWECEHSSSDNHELHGTGETVLCTTDGKPCFRVICDPKYKFHQDDITLEEFNTRMQYQDGYKASVRSFSVSQP